MDKNIQLGSIVDEVCEIMKKEDCRLMDSDIMRALKYTTFDYSNLKGIENIRVDTEDLVKY